MQYSWGHCGEMPPPLLNGDDDDDKVIRFVAHKHL